MPRLKTDEVGDVLQVARVRILRYLARQGVVRLLPEALGINDELAERNPVLAQLAAVAQLRRCQGCHPRVPSCAAGLPCNTLLPHNRVRLELNTTDSNSDRAGASRGPRPQRTTRANTERIQPRSEVADEGRSSDGDGKI